jgi:hypothetical protein
MSGFARSDATADGAGVTPALTPTEFWKPLKPRAYRSVQLGASGIDGVGPAGDFGLHVSGELSG